MAKRVQVVLQEDIRKLGISGDLVEVAPGYARNYLFPKGLAVRTTPGVDRKSTRLNSSHVRTSRMPSSA